MHSHGIEQVDIYMILILRMYDEGVSLEGIQEVRVEYKAKSTQTADMAYRYQQDEATSCSKHTLIVVTST